ncbi:UDP-N-acetylmuramate--L-alanine ligase domain protein [Mycobacterium xenopi 3993]|nr:UDP-N-acetylmuramate--L-alanine ligase domain protein [Mycobacterium xenopi 3993]
MRCAPGRGDPDRPRHVCPGSAARRPTAVITTHAAIPKTNPELVEARRRGIPVVLRPTVLAS